MQKLSHSGDQEIFRVAPEGETPKKIGSSFYRGENCNFNPYGGDHNASDFVQRFFLKGWSPQERFISPQTQITAFGSCFAHHIGEHLAKLGFDTAKRRASDIYVSKMGEGLVNVHSILQQFKWALEDWKPPSNLWHDYDAEEFDLKEDIRQKTRSVFLSTDVFILTFGLSEIWYDEVTGGVFWRAVPLKHFDPERHKFRVCTFEETKDCLSEIIRLIRTYVPNAKVVMTVSPIPLIATFRPVACITANSVSKAIIRAALDEVVRVHPDSGRELFYFPAYDMVTEAFPNRFVEDGRHLHPMIVPSIMRVFEALYCQTAMTIEAAEAAFSAARLANVATLDQHAFFSRARSGDAPVPRSLPSWIGALLRQLRLS